MVKSFQLLLSEFEIIKRSIYQNNEQLKTRENAQKDIHENICTVLMVNSLERFRATFTPNRKRISFTKKENKQFHASFIPKNNIIVRDSFYLLTFYFEKISN